MDMEKQLLAYFPGQGKSIRQFRRELLSASRVSGPLVISGEPGSGKEYTALALHRLLEPPGTPFLKGEITDTGFLDGLPAKGGRCTVYLDGCRPPLRRERSILKGILKDTGGQGRVILSLTTDPQEDEQRPPLPAFLDGSCSLLQIPPLRRRREDLPVIVGCLCQQNGHGDPLNLSPADLEHLSTHSWPGNFTELWSWLEERLPSGGGGVEGGSGPGKVPLGKILDREIDAWVGTLVGHSPRVTGILRKMTSKVERCLIKAVLERTGGQQVKSARILGINRNTLAQKIKEHGLGAHSRKRATRRKRAGS